MTFFRYGMCSVADNKRLDFDDDPDLDGNTGIFNGI